MPVTQRGLESFGEAIASMAGLSGSGNPLVLGDKANRALKAALKATVLGSQTDKQVEAELAKARKAFIRQARRMAKG